MLLQRGRRNAGDVPCHVEEERQVVSRHLRVVHIHDQQPAGIVVVGLAHLAVHQSRLRCRKPHVIVRAPPVAQVVIHASAAFALLLLGIAQARHVAVVVIAPHQHHVVGHAQPVLHYLEHLFIRDEHLGNLLHVFIDIFLQQLALVVDYRLQRFQLLFPRFYALHRTVVNAAHADGKQVFAALHLLQALYPVLLYLLAVRNIVVAAAHGVIPLGHVVAQQRFAVRRTDKDAAAVGHGLIAGDGEEARRARVHARPDGVGAQAQQQLEDALIRLWTDMPETGAGFVRAVAPRAQRPVFVVQEDAAIFYRRALQRLEAAVDGQPLLLLGLYVAPPYPRRHARLARELEQAIGRAAAVVAHDINPPVAGRQPEAVFLPRQFAYRHALLLQPLFYAPPCHVELHDLYRSLCLRLFLRFATCYLADILFEHVQRDAYHGRCLFFYRIAHTVLSVVPHHIRGLHGQRGCHSQGCQDCFHLHIRSYKFFFFADAKIRHSRRFTMENRSLISNFVRLSIKETEDVPAFNH